MVGTGMDEEERAFRRLERGEVSRPIKVRMEKSGVGQFGFRVWGAKVGSVWCAAGRSVYGRERENEREREESKQTQRHGWKMDATTARTGRGAAGASLFGSAG